jgi:hypothetical protein
LSSLLLQMFRPLFCFRPFLGGMLKPVLTSGQLTHRSCGLPCGAARTPRHAYCLPRLSTNNQLVTKRIPSRAVSLPDPCILARLEPHFRWLTVSAASASQRESSSRRTAVHRGVAVLLRRHRPGHHPARSCTSPSGFLGAIMEAPEGCDDPGDQR